MPTTNACFFHPPLLITHRGSLAAAQGLPRIFNLASNYFRSRRSLLGKPEDHRVNLPIMTLALGAIFESRDPPYFLSSSSGFGFSILINWQGRCSLMELSLEDMVYLPFLNRPMRFRVQFLTDLSSWGWVTLDYELAVSTMYADRLFSRVNATQYRPTCSCKISRNHI